MRMSGFEDFAGMDNGQVREPVETTLIPMSLCLASRHR